MRVAAKLARFSGGGFQGGIPAAGTGLEVFVRFVLYSMNGGIAGRQQRKAGTAFGCFKDAEDATGFHIDSFYLAEVVDVLFAQGGEQLGAGNSFPAKLFYLDDTVFDQDAQLALSDPFNTTIRYAGSREP